MNYTEQEYANDVVYHVGTVCDEAGSATSTHLESGRAVAAHHSVLVMETLGVTCQGSVEHLPGDLPDEYEQPVHDLLMFYQELNLPISEKHFMMLRLLWIFA